MKVPELTTERLLLRLIRAEDLDDCIAMRADENVVRYISGRAEARNETWARILRNIGHWQVMGYGYWAVEDRATGRFLGEVGFGNFEREIVPSLDGAPEIGWVFASHAHGRGIATEAVTAILAWADRYIDAALTVCIFAPENVASTNVARKSGYQIRGTAEISEHEVLVMERKRLT